MSIESSQKSIRICCIGAGYVGGPTCSIIAEKCPQHSVHVVDISDKRIAEWNSDTLPIYEPGLHEIVMAHRGKNLFFSTNVETEIAAADIIFISVNTPTKVFGEGKGCAPNLAYIESAARTIAKFAKKGAVVVEKSTVPLTCAESVTKILEANLPEGADYPAPVVLSNPEFLAEGTAIRDLRTPDRVLIGGPETPAGVAAVKLLVSVYAEWVPRDQIITTNTWSSELSKLAANAFLAQRVSSINAISALCEVSGADVAEVSKAIGSDSRIGPKFLQASVGWGGSCFQKDILNMVYLCRSFGLEEAAVYWKSVVDLNDYQKSRFAKAVVKSLFNTVSSKKIVILGWSFKKDTRDTRESAAIYVARDLLQDRAKISVYDPMVRESQFWRDIEHPDIRVEGVDPRKHCSFTNEGIYDVCKDADAVLIMTEWDSFKTLDWQRIYGGMKQPAWVFDGRMLLDHEALRNIGFKTFCIGRRSTAGLPPASKRLPSSF